MDKTNPSSVWIYSGATLGRFRGSRDVSVGSSCVMKRTPFFASFGSRPQRSHQAPRQPSGVRGRQGGERIPLDQEPVGRGRTAPAKAHLMTLKVPHFSEVQPRYAWRAQPLACCPREEGHSGEAELWPAVAELHTCRHSPEIRREDYAASRARPGVVLMRFEDDGALDALCLDSKKSMRSQEAVARSHQATCCQPSAWVAIASPILQ